MAIEKLNLDWKNKGESGYEDSKMNKIKMQNLTDKINELIELLNDLETSVSLKIDFKTMNIADWNAVNEGQLLSKTFIGTVQKDSTWYYFINLRHRNGLDDGKNFGLQIRKPLISGAKDFQWRVQNNGNWSGWESLI